MQREKTQPSNRKKELINWIISLAIAIVVVLFLRTFIFDLAQVKGESMYPTLVSDERLFVEKVSGYFGGYRRGDIVITHYPDSKDNFVKRIVALGGDTVEVTDSKLYLNGVLVQEPYINELITYETEKFTVPQGYFYVLGDNRNVSLDSHIESIGPVPEEYVQGKALFTIWPLDRFGSVY